MSFVELDAHPDRLDLMSLAMTYLRGTSDGERHRMVNPEIIKKDQELATKRQKLVERFSPSRSRKR